MRTHTDHTLLLMLFLAFVNFPGLQLKAVSSPDDRKRSGCCEQVSPNDSEDHRGKGAVRLRSQQLMELVLKQTPLTPPGGLANSMLHGVVTVEVCIDRKGRVIDVRVVEGHPLTFSSAIESVRHWRFVPYKRNGKPTCAVGLLTLKYDFRGAQTRGVERPAPH
jgi:TonB family protein